MKAFNALRRQDRRQLRAMSLLAEVMQIVYPELRPEADPRHVHNRLMDLFMDKGVEILTDYERSEIGLPPRDRLGWTVEEILALEKTRLDAMLRPMPMFLPKSEP